MLKPLSAAIFLKRIILCLCFLFLMLSSFSQNYKGAFRLHENCNQHELYVSFIDDRFAVRKNIASVLPAEITGFQKLMNDYALIVEKEILISEEKIASLAENAIKLGNDPYWIYNLRRIYKICLPNADNATLYKLAGDLEQFDEVLYASLIPSEPTKPPYDIMPKTSDYEHLQNYLNPNPGVDILYAWERGLIGEEIRVRDVEYGVNMEHEELNEKNIALGIGMTISNDASVEYTEHGTAVFGIICGDKGDYGISGMAHGIAEMILFPEWQQSGYNRSYAVSQVIEASEMGDVIIYEMQARGEEGEYVPAEFDMVIWNLTKAGTDAGIVIVAAAGNGNQNLDSDFYDSYNRRGHSGAIIVGAGSPDLNHSRLWFSTYGSRVDLQGWGSNVLTSGYGDYRQIGGDFNQSYTQFSGTSSATPIVASCVVILQSYYYQQTGKFLTGIELRNILVETGIPQGGNTLQHIGPLPNMRAAIQRIDSMLVMHTGAVHGWITDMDGNPIQNANVKVENTDNKTITDERGYYIFPLITAEEYDITASKQGYITQTNTVMVTISDTTELSFTLPIDELGIEKNEKKLSVHIFPNPAKEFVIIEGENIKKVELYNITGQLLRYLTNDDSSFQKINIDINSFTSGNYILKIYNHTEHIVKKLEIIK